MSVTVRRKRSWRNWMRFLFVLDAASMVLLCWMSAEILTVGTGLVLFGMMTAPAATLLLHEERWSVTFSREGILWKKQLRPWSQVERVWESHSVTERQVISIRFRDGRTLRLRMEEENAGQARKTIIRHCSIKTSPHP